MDEVAGALVGSLPAVSYWSPGLDRVESARWEWGWCLHMPHLVGCRGGEGHRLAPCFLHWVWRPHSLQALVPSGLGLAHLAVLLYSGPGRHPYWGHCGLYQLYLVTCPVEEPT